MVVALLASVAGAVPAGAAPAREGGDLTIDSVDVSREPEISLSVSTGAELGRRSSAAVREGRQPWRPARVVPLPTEGLEVVVLLDVSGSMTGAPIAAAIAASQQFVGQLPADVAVGVVAFSDTARLLTAPTLDRSVVLGSLGGLQATGETALYDGVRRAAETFSPGASRRSIVLLSDGGDTASVAPLQDAIAALQTGVQLDAIELESTESNREALDRLTADGRGVVLSGTDPSTLSSLYGRVAERLVNRYVVRFRSARSDVETLALRIRNRERVLTASTKLPVPAERAGDETSPVAPLSADVSSVSFWLAGVLVFAGLAVAAFIVFGTRDRHSRVRRRLGAPKVEEPTRSFTDVIDSWIDNEGEPGRIATLLDASGSTRTPGSFVALVAFMAVLASLLGLAMFGPLGFVLAPPLTVGVAVAFMRKKASRRRQLFAEQLPDALKVIANMLRSGYGLAQALDVATEQAGDPIRTWVGQAVVEMRADRDPGAALRDVAARAGSVDFEWVATAIEINREVGGDLSEILDGLSDTVRDRARIKGQVRALSAEGRMSAYVVLALPPTVMAVTALTNPGYVSRLGTGTGLVLLFVAGVLMVVGYVWMRRLVAKVM
ncbi:MAG: VWA domain-containing protein [Actinomycetota bacterium]